MKIDRLLLLGIMVGGVTMYLSCRKTDNRSENRVINNSDTNFFDSHQATNPIIQAIIRFMKNANSEHNFTGHIVKEMGIPYWDKSILYYLPQSVSGRTASDTSYVAYIPIVQNGQNYVDGQLTVKVTPTDTTFNFLSDRQYDEFGFQPNADSLLNGLKIFCLFAKHEKNVFGHTKFTILDNRIFKGQTTVGIDSTKSYMVELDTINSSARPGSSSAPPPLPNSSCILVNEMIASGYSVTYSQVGAVCVISSYTLGGEFSGGGGGGGTGGWTPDPGASIPPEPIDSLLAKYSRLANIYRDSLSALCESEHKERFFNIVNYNNQLDTFRVLTSTSDEEVIPNYYMIGGRILKAEWHYHEKYSDGTPGSWPSGGDVVKLFDKPVGHVMIIDTYDTRYALVVENANMMIIWEHIFGNGPQKFPYKVRDAVLADPRSSSTTSSIYVNMTREKILAALGNSSACGIGLYQASSANGTTFTKVN
jgi:hypothetical protein